MAQTNLTSNMQVADGTKLMIKLPSDAEYTDIGVVDGDVQVALEWEDFQEESANAGTLAKYIKNPKANGSFTLRELNYDNISKMSSGLMEHSFGRRSRGHVPRAPGQRHARGLR